MKKEDECNKLSEWIETNVGVITTTTFSSNVNMHDGLVTKIEANPEDDEKIESLHESGFLCHGDHPANDEFPNPDFQATTSDEMLRHVVDAHWKEAGFESQEDASSYLDIS